MTDLDKAPNKESNFEVTIQCATAKLRVLLRLIASEPDRHFCFLAVYPRHYLKWLMSLPYFMRVLPVLLGDSFWEFVVPTNLTSEYNEVAENIATTETLNLALD